MWLAILSLITCYVIEPAAFVSSPASVATVMASSLSTDMEFGKLT